MDNTHAVAAEAHIDAVKNVKRYLDEIHADPDRCQDESRIRRLNQEIGVGLALAKIEATLAVADATRESAAAFRDWTSLADEPLAPPAELRVLERREEADDQAREVDPHAWPASPYGEGRVQS